ncbi:MAG: ANTAR domain-containing protein [Alphaproteobacteria bacterium]
MTPMRILVVDDSEDRGLAVMEGLAGTECTVVGPARSSAALREMLKREDIDVVIASMSSPDRDTLESLRDSSAATPRAIVMFVDEEGADMAGEAVQAGVSAYVVDGFSTKRVRSVLEVAIARFQKFESLRLELEESKAALADRKVVERAKGVLMEQRGLSEPDAYALLRKTAMAQNQKIIDVAKSILSVAALLKT